MVGWEVNFGALPSVSSKSAATTKWIPAILQGMTYLGIAAIAILWVSVEGNLAFEHDKTLSAAEKQNANLARVFEENVIRSLSEVDAQLRYLRDMYELDPGRTDVARLAQKGSLSTERTIQFGLIGPDGFLRSTTLGPVSEPVNLGDREHFLAQRDAQGDALFISKPIYGKVTRRMVIQLTRRIRNSDGSFGGVAVASLDLLQLGGFFDSVDLGPKGSVMLVGTDGVVRASGPFLDNVVGSSVRDEPLFKTVTATNAGTYRGPFFNGLPRRLVAFRAVRGYPLIITVCASEDHVLAAHTSHQLLFRSAAGVGTLVVLVVIGVGVRHRRSLASAMDRLERGKVELDVMLGNIAQGIQMVDGEGRAVRVNRRAVELIDLPEAFLRSPPSHADYLRFLSERGEFRGYPEKQATADAVMKQGGVGPIVWGDHERTRPDGTVLAIHTTALADGGFVRTFTDVTAERRQEAALKASEELNRARSKELAAMFDSIDEGIIMVDRSGCSLRVNRRTIELLDLPASFLIEPPSYLGLVNFLSERGEYRADPEMQKRTDALIMRGAPGDIVPGTYERTRPDGTILEIHTFALPDGGFVRTLTDVTERRHHEAAVQRSEQFSRAKGRELAVTLENMSQGIMMVDREGTVAVLNRQAVKLLDLPERFLEYRPKFVEIHEYQRESGEYENAALTPDPLLERFVREGGDPTLYPSYERVRPNGLVLEVRTVSFPDGGFVRTYTDITERKRQENAIQAAAGDLERFAHLASHDLQEPLRKIGTHVGLLKDALAASDAEEVERCLDVLSRTSKRGRDIVTDLLRYSKLRNRPVDRLPSRIDALVDEVGAQLVDPLNPDRFEIDNRLPATEISCDEPLIRQVFENIIGNAIKYRKADEKAHVSVFGFKNTITEKFVINIADNGIGFDNAYKARIFEPFQRLVPQHQFPGTGIGLSLVHSIVEKHGWAIDVESEVGVGTTFMLSIPLADLVTSRKDPGEGNVAAAA